MRPRREILWPGGLTFGNLRGLGGKFYGQAARGGSVRVGFGTTARHPRVAFAWVPARPHLQPGGRAVCWFFPNDLRCGFRKLKEEGGGKSVFWSSSGAELFVVVVVIFIFMHAGPTSKSAW